MPDPTTTPDPILAEMKKARGNPASWGLDADGYTTVPGWMVFDYKEAAEVAKRIRDEAVTAERKRLAESAGVSARMIRDAMAPSSGDRIPCVDAEQACQELTAYAVGNAVTEERANYDGAMADLHALVAEARPVVDAHPGTLDFTKAVQRLRWFLNANYPVKPDAKEADQP